MSHTETSRNRILVASIAFFALTGCGDSTGPVGPDDPGVLLVPMGQSGFWPTDLVWSKDGTELIYAENGLKAVTISTAVVRQLNASPSITTLARATTGERIYFGAFVEAPPGSTSNYEINRLHPVSGGLETIATILPGNHLAVSDDERLVAVDRQLVDLETGRTLTLPSGTPLGFSPDGSQLLYRDALTVPVLISTADGSSQSLHSSVSIFYVAHRWEGNSPQLLEETVTYGSKGTVRFSERDGLTGVTRDIVQLPTSDIIVTARWSADGHALASWIEQGSRTNLYVIRTGSAPAVVASFATRSEKSPGTPVFSPSGNSLAYFYYDDIRRSLYVKSGI